MEQIFEFDCPECSQRFKVDESVRRNMIEIGCIICESEVTQKDFTPLENVTQ